MSFLLLKLGFILLVYYMWWWSMLVPNSLFTRQQLLSLKKPEHQGHRRLRFIEIFLIVNQFVTPGILFVNSCYNPVTRTAASLPALGLAFARLVAFLILLFKS